MKITHAQAKYISDCINNTEFFPVKSIDEISKSIGVINALAEQVKEYTKTIEKIVEDNSTIRVIDGRESKEYNAKEVNDLVEQAGLESQDYELEASQVVYIKEGLEGMIKRRVDRNPIKGKWEMQMILDLVELMV